jgi:hypothetical protein
LEDLLEVDPKASENIPGPVENLPQSWMPVQSSFPLVRLTR